VGHYQLVAAGDPVHVQVGPARVLARMSGPEIDQIGAVPGKPPPTSAPGVLAVSLTSERGTLDVPARSSLTLGERQNPISVQRRPHGCTRRAGPPGDAAPVDRLPRRTHDLHLAAAGQARGDLGLRRRAGLSQPNRPVQRVAHGPFVRHPAPRLWLSRSAPAAYGSHTRTDRRRRPGCRRTQPPPTDAEPLPARRPGANLSVLDHGRAVQWPSRPTDGPGQPGTRGQRRGLRRAVWLRLSPAALGPGEAVGSSGAPRSWRAARRRSAVP